MNISDAINDVFDEISNMSKDEFDKAIDEHEPGDIAQIVYNLLKDKNDFN